MNRLDKKSFVPIYDLYQSSEIFFPLIAAVLLDEQDGAVFADDAYSPSQAYVEHAFGFAQIFGIPNAEFERELERYLLINKRFAASKVRLYAPYLPGFLDSPRHDGLKSSRQRFHISTESFSTRRSDAAQAKDDTLLCEVDSDNIALIDGRFGVATRFWRTAEDFIAKSNAIVALYQGEPASICYSAAEADRRVEIDVLTLPEHRNRGLAKYAVTGFIERCFSVGLRPLWDCFTNNAGSMRLCESVGFTAAKSPYAFFTIGRDRPETGG